MAARFSKRGASPAPGWRERRPTRRGAWTL